MKMRIEIELEDDGHLKVTPKSDEKFTNSEWIEVLGVSYCALSRFCGESKFKCRKDILGISSNVYKNAKINSDENKE
jgi:hypothetical protein